MKLTFILRATAVASFCCLANAQLVGGGDDCNLPDAISGPGSFFFDNSLATTGAEGQSESICYEFATTTVINDVWFDWTSTFTGMAKIDTCGSPTDTKIAAYPGAGCPTTGTALGCNDDSCGWQSEIQIPVVSGQVYAIQVGLYPFATGGTGNVNIAENAPQLNPANGHYYWIVSQSGLTWDQAKVAAEGMTHLGFPGYLATLTDQAENDFVYAMGNPQWHWIGGFQNLNSPTYSEPAGGWEWVTGEPWVYENWHPGEPNNTGGLGAEDHLEMLSAASGFTDGWNDAAAEHPAGFVVEFSGGFGPGTAYCPGDGIAPHTLCPCVNNNNGDMGGCDWGDPAFPEGGVLGATGSDSMAANDTVLTATGVADNFGIFFGANNAVNGGNGNPLNDGLRCAGGGLVRLIPPTMASGNQLTLPASIQTLDIGAGSGVTRRYQYWFRTPGGPCGQMANLTNGYEIVWMP